MKLDRLSLLMLDLCDSGLERLCIWRISVTIWSGFWVATMKPKLLVLAIALSLIFIVLAGLNRSQGTLFWCYDSKLCPISACMQWMLCLATYIAPMKRDWRCKVRQNFFVAASSLCLTTTEVGFACMDLLVTRKIQQISASDIKELHIHKYMCTSL